MHIRFHAIEAGPNQGSKIDFVNDPDIAPSKHHRMFVYNIISFRSTDNHNSFFCTEQKIGRADHITDVFYEQDINVVKGEILYDMFNEMGIEMTFLPGIGIYDRNAKDPYPLVIIISIHISSDCSGSETLSFQERH